MFLLEFNSTSLQREAGVVFKSAEKGPVLISRTGGKTAMVILTKEKYAELVKK